ncbi:hypothetical protein, partial [Thiolapillus sp.]|uniref:hypothetical protein n=3 Tax=Thiolapillus sp. TaxID=2017437 RepID=UPI002738A1D6
PRAIESRKVTVPLFQPWNRWQSTMICLGKARVLHRGLQKAKHYRRAIALLQAMKHIVLLPGMDGTGILFEPLIQAFSSKVHPHIIDYSIDEALDYDQLAGYVRTKLPTNVPYTLIAESFSGPVGYEIACTPPPNLKHLPESVTSAAT